MALVPLYTIEYSPQAIKDIAFFKKSGNVSVQKKITKLIAELEEHPTRGSGQVEALKYDLTGFWSRRITDEHRLVYEIDEDLKIVYIFKMRGHY